MITLLLTFKTYNHSFLEGYLRLKIFFQLKCA